MVDIAITLEQEITKVTRWNPQLTGLHQEGVEEIRLLFLDEISFIQHLSAFEKTLRSVTHSIDRNASIDRAEIRRVAAFLDRYLDDLQALLACYQSLDFTSPILSVDTPPDLVLHAFEKKLQTSVDLQNYELILTRLAKLHPEYRPIISYLRHVYEGDTIESFFTSDLAWNPILDLFENELHSKLSQGSHLQQFFGKYTPIDTVADNTHYAVIARNDRGDSADYMLRKLLEMDTKSPAMQREFSIKLKTILLTCYPNLFVEENNTLQPQPNLSSETTELIKKALNLKSETEDFLFNWNNFDYVALDELFQQDANVLWIVLKQLISINTTVLHNDEPLQFTPVQKMETYIQLAEAFQAGSASKPEQIMNSFLNEKLGLNLDGSVSRLGYNLAENQVKIKTPGIDKALQGVYAMAIKAFELAKEYPECLPLAEEVFMPTKKKGLLMAISKRSINLGDWLTTTGLFIDRKYANCQDHFQSIVGPQSSQNSTTDDAQLAPPADSSAVQSRAETYKKNIGQAFFQGVDAINKQANNSLKELEKQGKVGHFIANTLKKK